jgi:hypothetical protein
MELAVRILSPLFQTYFDSVLDEMKTKEIILGRSTPKRKGCQNFLVALLFILIYLNIPFSGC